jgi:hypothetical protein
VVVLGAYLIAAARHADSWKTPIVIAGTAGLLTPLGIILVSLSSGGYD